MKQLASIFLFLCLIFCVSCGSFLPNTTTSSTEDGGGTDLTDATETTTTTSSDNDNQLIRQAFTVESVPRIDIKTNGTINSFETYTRATFSMTDAVVPANNVATRPLGIRFRGNTSAQFDKKPYKLKFDSKVDLFGFGSEKEWGLINNHMDYSMIRNFLAYRFGMMLNFEYDIECHFVELYLNEDYRGLYLLTELVETGSSRVDIEDSYNPAKPAEVPFLLERDEKSRGSTCGTSNKECFNLDVSEFGIEYEDTNVLPFATKFPGTFEINNANNFANDPDFVTTAQYNYIYDSVEEMYASVYTDDYEDVIDIDSFIDYFIVQELFQNADCGYSSVYFYKEPGKKIKFGPLWDFDLSSGGYRYGSRNATDYGRWMGDIDGRGGNVLFVELLKKPAFKAKFAERYNEIYETIVPVMLSEIENITTALTAAAARNEDKWDVLGKKLDDWSTPDWIAQIPTFAGQTQYVKTFLENRSAWINSVLEVPKIKNVNEKVKIEAENFASKSGAVNTQPCTDTGGGLNLAYIDANDTFSYVVSLVPGTYKIKYRIASESTAGRLNLAINNQSKITTDFTITGGWQTYRDYTSATFTVTESGSTTLVFTALTSSFNINWFEITRVS